MSHVCSELKLLPDVLSDDLPSHVRAMIEKARSVSTVLSASASSCPPAEHDTVHSHVSGDTSTASAASANAPSNLATQSVREPSDRVRVDTACRSLSQPPFNFKWLLDQSPTIMSLSIQDVQSSPRTPITLAPGVFALSWSFSEPVVATDIVFLMDSQVQTGPSPSEFDDSKEPDDSLISTCLLQTASRAHSLTLREPVVVHSTESAPRRSKTFQWRMLTCSWPAPQQFVLLAFMRLQDGSVNAGTV
jgi:hypothetical protein